MGVATVRTDPVHERVPPRSIERRSRAATLDRLAVWAVATYAFVALVVATEGPTSLPMRALRALVIVVVAVALDLAVRRGGRVAGGVMAGVGLVTATVVATVAVPRLATAVTVRELFGAVAAVAAVVLVVDGWRMLLGGLRHRSIRVVIAVLATLVVAQFVLLPVGVALVATQRARPQASDATPADAGLVFTDVRVPAADGVELAAWWIAPRNGAAVIVLPGSGSTRDDVLDEAAFVARHGYGSLLLDARGHGDSGGRPMEFGWGHERDVAAAIDWVEAQPGVDRVGLYGLSMGGEVALTTAALDPRVDAVVAEGASARIWDDAAAEPHPHPVGLANTWVTFLVTDLLTPTSPPEPLLELVPRIDAPTLLITGSPANERSLGRLYAGAAPDVVTMWEIPSAPHVGGLATEPHTYPERVLSHLDAALLGRAA